MNPLVIAGRLGEFVDRCLIDRDPIGGADFFADVVLHVFRIFDGAHIDAFYKSLGWGAVEAREFGIDLDAKRVECH